MSLLLGNSWVKPKVVLDREEIELGGCERGVFLDSWVDGMHT